MKTLIDRIKTIGYVFFSFIQAIPFYVFRILPLNSKRVYVYGFLNQGFGDHPKYIINELLKRDDGFRFIWTTKKTDNEPFDKIIYVKPKTLKAAFYQATSKFWISTVRMPFYMKKRKHQVYFQTWHGAVNLKKIEGECLGALTKRYVIMAKHDSQMIDYLVAANQDKVSEFSKYFWFESGEILKIGSPRNDIFFNSDDQMIRMIRSKYNCENKKVMLYAPTFRASRSLDNYKLDYKQLLDAATSRFGGEWIVFVRLHPTMAKRADELVKYDECVRNGSMIDDIQELLLITDFLITDYSSIVFDYMDKEMPAVLYAPDIEEYTKERDFHISPLQTPFPIAKSQEALVDSICCYELSDYIDNLRAFSKQIGVYDDGTASKKIAEKIIELSSN